MIAEFQQLTNNAENAIIKFIMELRIAVPDIKYHSGNGDKFNPYQIGSYIGSTSTDLDQAVRVAPSIIVNTADRMRRAIDEACMGPYTRTLFELLVLAWANEKFNRIEQRMGNLNKEKMAFGANMDKIKIQANNIVKELIQLKLKYYHFEDL